MGVGAYYAWAAWIRCSTCCDILARKKNQCRALEQSHNVVIMHARVYSELGSPTLNLEQEFQRLTLCGCFAPQTLDNPVPTKVLCNGAYKGPRSRNHSLSVCTLLAQTMTRSYSRPGFSLEFKIGRHLLAFSSSSSSFFYYIGHSQSLQLVAYRSGAMCVKTSFFTHYCSDCENARHNAIIFFLLV